jgi:hypothetical protein
VQLHDSLDVGHMWKHYNQCNMHWYRRPVLQQYCSDVTQACCSALLATCGSELPRAAAAVFHCSHPLRTAATTAPMCSPSAAFDPVRQADQRFSKASLLPPAPGFPQLLFFWTAGRHCCMASKLGADESEVDAPSCPLLPGCTERLLPCYIAPRSAAVHFLAGHTRLAAAAAVAAERAWGAGTQPSHLDTCIQVDLS